MLRKRSARGEFSRWERALSRRRFLHVVAGTAGALGAGLLCPTPALAAGRNPKPIPGGGPNPVGGPFLHFNFPGPADATGTPDNPVGSPGNPGSDPSTITDFDGFIGVARVQGTGTGTNTVTGDKVPLLFDADVRFMQGIYQSVDGRFFDTTLVFV
jgi:hypothetical protein